MSSPLPIVYEWRVVDVVDGDGVVSTVEAMVPIGRYRKLARKQFGDPAEREQHALEAVQSRDMKRHNAFFAAVHDSFLNLPEGVAPRFPSEEHLRKWALIECNFFDEKEFEADSPANARGLALFVRTQDEYARISVHGRKVIVRRAKSQSLAAMGAAEFYDSKKAVLDLLSSMIGVKRGELQRNAGRAA